MRKLRHIGKLSLKVYEGMQNTELVNITLKEKQTEETQYLVLKFTVKL